MYKKIRQKQRPKSMRDAKARGRQAVRPSADLTFAAVTRLRIVPRNRDARFVYSIEMKRQWSENLDYECPAVLDERVLRQLEQAALRAHAALGCRDIARIDFRVRDETPYFLEANPLPGLAPGWSDLVILARKMGIDYPELIGRILDAALARIEARTAGPQPQGTAR